MPWSPDEAERHTHKASLESTGDEGRAIREANAVTAKVTVVRSSPFRVLL
jgi:hypothetical protein